MKWTLTARSENGPYFFSKGSTITSPFSKGGLTPLEVSQVKVVEQEALGIQHEKTLLTGLRGIILKSNLP
jgi:hypothetical protein